MRKRTIKDHPGIDPQKRSLIRTALIEDQMNHNERTETENAINRKLDALKESVELLAGGTEKGRWKAVEGVRSAWKEEEGDD